MTNIAIFNVKNYDDDDAKPKKISENKNTWMHSKLCKKFVLSFAEPDCYLTIIVKE